MPFQLFKSLDKKVEEDKKRLLSELKSADIKTLIIQMDNNEPISENIVKKQKRDMSFGSEDSPSWFAYRVSDELSDKNQKTELIKLLSDEEFEKHKKHILRCLSSLCVNNQDYELFDFLISSIKQSNNEDFITTVLSRLRDLKKPETLNIEFLKFLLTDGTYQNRIDALSGLQNSQHSDIEELLIQEFKRADQHTKEMICATLRTTGTDKCFEVLDEEYKRTRSNTLKYFIESAKEKIKKRKNISS
ncbi:hypothetical protein ACOSP6_00320 [Tenacibaculum sp. MEBiC06402]|uniref:hypothetical protein n=1 Tax=Tenacibaculum sp. MEBiC06402 TaxID=3412023 RepID=UPI003B9D60B6